ncbi:MAG: sigma factor regulator FecR, partial [Acidobacteria bacterium]|nr:sigma factor regulator FecR [Acidobacteriota bacterium]
MRSGTAPGAAVAAAHRLVAEAAHIVGFTGAGISTESGVPDFRSPGGVWAENRIVDFQEFVSSEEGRIEYWRQKAAAWPAMRDAQPNAGHNAFFEIHRQGRLDALITQNIERLHQRSGVPAEKVFE